MGATGVLEDTNGKDLARSHWTHCHHHLVLFGRGLVGRLKLPKVLGYLFVGMVIGPYALALVDPEILDSVIYRIILILAIGLVGYSISSGIRVEELKKYGAKIFVIALFEAYTLFLLVALAMYYLLHFDLPTAMVIGAIALPTAPVAALSIFHADLMITGISFGLVLVNSLKEDQLGQFQEANRVLIGLAVILFLTAIGGTLDITAILSLTALASALVYFIVRAAGKLTGARIGAMITRSEPAIQKYLGPTLLAAAGVSLTSVGIATPVIPKDQAMRMGIMIAAAALINEIVAVLATRLGFQKAGEINKAASMEYVSQGEIVGHHRRHILRLGGSL